MSIFSHKWAKTLIGAFSFAVTSTTSVLAEDIGTHEEQSFSCEILDRLSWTGRSDMLQHAFSSTVYIQPRKNEAGYGSGFFISNNGYIVTNAHVSQKEPTGTIRVFDENQRNHIGQEFPYTLIGEDQNTDLAVLKVEMDRPAHCAVLNPDVHINYYDEVFAIGHPFGLTFSLTDGIVSMPERSDSRFFWTDIIQTDVVINPGNSGGPLFNNFGEFLGVNVGMITEDERPTGLSYTIPVSTVWRITDQLIRDGEVPYSFVGLQTENLPNNAGVLVKSFSDHSPADLAGLKVGDYITHANGQPLRDGIDLIHTVVPNHPGTTFNLSVIRDGREFETRLTVEDESTFHQRVAIIEHQKKQASIPALVISGN